MKQGMGFGVLLGLLVAPIIALRGESGKLDQAFDAGTIAGTNCCSLSGVQAVAVQADGQIIIAGYLRMYNLPRHRIARLNQDGSLDSTFDAGSWTNGEIQSFVIQSDKKIVIGGAFQTVQGGPGNFVARLNPDGSRDTEFNAQAVVNGTIFSIGLQQDQKLVIGGSFTTVNDQPRIGIARLNSDGSLDTSFTSPFIAGFVRSLVCEANGKIVVTGIEVGSCRLNPDGGIDATFHQPDVVNTFVVAVQTDLKVFVGGDFSQIGTVTRQRIARLNVDGSIDTTFDPMTGPNSGIRCIYPLPDGKTLIGGNFTSYRGTTRPGIARIFSDGSLDTSFDAGNITPPYVSCLTAQLDGKLIAGGEFTAVQNMTRFHIARLDGDPILTAKRSGSNVVLSWPATYTDFSVESTSTLPTLNDWIGLSDVPEIVGDRFVITVPIGSDAKFFRLKK